MCRKKLAGLKLARKEGAGAAGVRPRNARPKCQWASQMRSCCRFHADLTSHLTCECCCLFCAVYALFTRRLYCLYVKTCCQLDRRPGNDRHDVPATRQQQQPCDLLKTSRFLDPLTTDNPSSKPQTPTHSAAPQLQSPLCNNTITKLISVITHFSTRDDHPPQRHNPPQTPRIVAHQQSWRTFTA